MPKIKSFKPFDIRPIINIYHKPAFLYSSLKISELKNLAEAKYKESSLYSPYKIGSLAKKYIEQIATSYKEETLFSPYKSGHIILEDNPTIDANYRDKAFIRQENGNKSLLLSATKEEIDQSNIIALGGLDFDNPQYLSALLKSIKTLATLTSAGQEPAKAIAIFPEVSRQERYEAAVKFSLNSDYYPNYIKDRVENYLLPQIINENKLTSPENPITLMSFSVGGREVIMMENALKKILKSEWSLDNQELSNMLAHFRAFCIAYAIDPGHAKTPGFEKVVIFSVDDYGVLRPETLYNKFLVVPQVKQNIFSVYKLAVEQYLVVLGHNTIPHQVNGKIHPTDHSLPHYVEAIKLLPLDIKQEIQNWFCNPINENEGGGEIVNIIGNTLLSDHQYA